MQFKSPSQAKINFLTAQLPPAANSGEEPPFKPRPYQFAGIETMHYLENSSTKGGLNGDAMGLGKTFTCGMNIKAYPKAKPALVACPLTAIPTIWVRTLRKLGLKVLWYYSPRQTEKFNNYDVVVCTHQRVRLDCAGLRGQGSGWNYGQNKIQFLKSRIGGQKWSRVYVDEAQCLQNPRSITARVFTNLTTEIRWAISGTPFQNDYDSLLALFSFLGVKPYCNRILFERQFLANKRARQKAELLTETSQALLAITLSSVSLRRQPFHFFEGKQIMDLPDVVCYYIKEKLRDEEQATQVDMGQMGNASTGYDCQNPEP
jgi:SNF2 family DNA or RNA helicase